ncbi:glycosyl transferase family 1 [Halomonas sp. S2151]|uniref:glycosyltransferase n=1 Tax=Halomonas sp. S2151 TaxID=579478 RepID=UPI0005F9F5B8|nr:glycosyltransferase [Halomonas sp. S2151]KJZ13663.1 glycosyl transferase family 1 [Halomonas sp. S2151]
MNHQRIAFVIEDLYGGGAQKSLLYTADQLRQRGHAVKVLTLRDKVEHRLPDGLDIENLAVVTRLTKATSTVLTEKWQARKVQKALETWRPEVVISCSCDKITRHLDWPNLYFWIKSDVSAKFSDPAARDKAFAKVRRFYGGRKVIAVSEGVKQNLEQEVGLEAETIIPIYNPYEREPFVAMADELLSLPAGVEEGRYLLSVAAIEPRKRQDRLLRAYRQARDKHGLDIPLVLLGKGKPENEQRLKAMIGELGLGDHIHWLGYTANPYPYILNALAMVLTSDAEGLPRVLIEALLLHTPVISVDCPSGPKEILTQELKDFLVARDDEAGLASAMARMTEAPVNIEPRHYQQFLRENVLPKFEALQSGSV